MVKKKLCWEEGCAVLHCWRKARGERRLRQDALLSVAGLMASPTRHSREDSLLGVGGKQKKKPPKPLPASGRRRREEKKRERGGGEFAGMSGGEKRPAVPEYPRSLPEGRQRQELRAGQRHCPLNTTRQENSLFSLQSYYKRAEEIYSWRNRYNKGAHRGPSSSSSSSFSVKCALSQKKTNSVGLPTVPYTCRKLHTVRKS